MPNSYFRFKKFIIHQEKTAMKVGTDGVLLGAWANVKHASKILDVGTGTGLIALMMAQRSGAKIHAIELEENAFHQAIENVNLSPWAERITIQHTSFQQYANQHQGRFDLIVSNPPYFIGSLPSPGKERTRARHSTTMTFDDLLHGSIMLLKKKGILSVILPYTEGLGFIDKALKYGLYCVRKTQVQPHPDRSPKRLLLEFGREAEPLKKGELIIENGERHEFSKEYIELTKDFYLNF